MNEPEERTSDPALSRIYRQAGGADPSAALDAAILAAARGATTKPVRRTRWWQRLAAPIALAATVVMAVMLSVTVERQPQAPEPRLPKNVPAEQAPAPVEERQLQKAVPPAARDSSPAPRAKLEPRPAAKAPAREEAPAAAEAPRPAPPAPAPVTAGTLAEKKMEKADSADRVAPAMKEAMPRFESRNAAPAAAGAQRLAVPAPTPEAWIEEIRQLRRQGKDEAAARRLAEFRTAYPDYRLPDDLH